MDTLNADISSLISEQQNFTRSDYAPTQAADDCARIEHIEEGSPAHRAGLEVGMIITHVEEAPLRDMIDWSWYGDDFELYLEGLYYDSQAESWEEFECTLERNLGEDWGVEFTSVVFDGIRTCKNACVFCFMSMLPKDMRSSLYLRDDDYRLSFLQGNFVTFTNMDSEDVARVIEQRLSPLNMSLHVINPELRRSMIGKNHARGIEVLEELLAHDIEIHGQIVLCPGLNDGIALQETLEYIEARPLITSVGIVPLGFTRHQKKFSTSFQDKEAAAAVLDIVRPFQERALKQFGQTRYQLADEFYLWTQELPPEAASYDGYPQYYDGIGMYRYFLDEFYELLHDRESSLWRLSEALDHAQQELICFTGSGFAPAFARLIEEAKAQGACTRIQVRAVVNEYFGGNVDVAGLMCVEDIRKAMKLELKCKPEGFIASLPDVMFNFDKLSLDGVSLDEFTQELQECGIQLHATPTEPKPFFEFLLHVVDYRDTISMSTVASVWEE